MDNMSNFAKDRLQAASRARDKSRQLALLCSVAAGVTLILLAVAMLDYWFLLPMSARLGGVTLLLAVLGVGARQFVKSRRQTTRLKEAALDAEASRPDLGCELSTAAEYLSGDRKISQEYEAEVAAALQEKAARNLKSFEPVYWKRPLRPAILLGVAAFAVLAFGILASGAFTAFERAAAPWSNAAYTQVQVKPGNVEIPVGRDVEIKSVFSGRVPTEAQFEWHDSANPKWQFASLKRSEQGDYIYPLKNIRSAVKYRVSGSDAVSSEFTVDPYVPPDVKAWHVALDLPAYTKQPRSTQEVPEITVLRGSTATVQITPTVKLAKAKLRFKDQAPINLQEDANGEWNGNFNISKDAEYWVELADAKGHTGGNEEPFHIKALPDLAPKVEVLDPGQDMRSETTNIVEVRISATDDYGLNEMRLVYHRIGDPEQSIVAKRTGETNSEFSAQIPLLFMGLRPYEIVAYHGEAVDNNTLDGPGVGKSDVFFIEITDEPGGSCKMPKPGQKVNLLVIQKQIVSDTSALANKAPATAFQDLAKRQKDAEDFGEMYIKAMSQNGAPEPAIAEMEAAVSEMKKAQDFLEKNERPNSLPPEESALAKLYHTLALMPELKDLPTVPPPAAQPKTNNSPTLQVVLEAIKKKKKEEPDNKEIAKALQDAKALQQAQASLVIGSQNPGSSSAPGETKLDRSGKESKPGEAKSDAPKESPKDEAKNGDPKNGEGKDGQKLAEKENGLSKEAKALADKLARMAGKDARLGHGVAKKMGDAAAKMSEAAQAANKGDMQKAGTKGAESGMSLDSAIALLERILNDRPELADVSKEDFPKQYEAAIGDYFKKLSHEE
jgi:hypothetical protein